MTVRQAVQVHCPQSTISVNELTQLIGVLLQVWNLMTIKHFFSGLLL